MSGYLVRQPPANGLPTVFCFHHAGGGASAYSSWPSLLTGVANVCPVQLPGREGRFNEARDTQLTPLVDAIVETLAPHLEEPYLLYGHSLGGLLAYHVQRRIGSRDLALPTALIVGACAAPHLSTELAQLISTGALDLGAALAAVGGLPPELLAYPDWLEIFLAVIRDDLALFCDIPPVDGPPLDCPIETVHAIDDPLITMRASAAWEHHAGSSFQLHLLEGGHLFHKHAASAVTAIVAAATARLPTYHGSASLQPAAVELRLNRQHPAAGGPSTVSMA